MEGMTITQTVCEGAEQEMIDWMRSGKSRTIRIETDIASDFYDAVVEGVNHTPAVFEKTVDFDAGGRMRTHIKNSQGRFTATIRLIKRKP